MPPKRKNPFHNHNPNTTSTSYKKRNKTSAPTTAAGDDYHRKHSASLADPASLPPRAIEGVQRGVIEEIRKGNKTVFRAVKKARDFETRKLVRRLKTAREKKEATVDKIAAELAACKIIPTDEITKLAEEHILRTLGKKRRVVTSLLWPKALVVPAAADPNGDKTKANVVSRLYGATVVRDAVKEVVESVEGTMGLRENEVVVKPTEEDEDEGEDENEGAEEKEEEEVVVLSDREVELSDGDRVVEESEEFGGFSDTPGAAGDEKSAAPELDNDDWDRIMDPNSTDFADFEDRIGASDDEDEVEGSDEEEDESRGELERTDDEWSGSEDDEETSKPAPSKEPTANKNKKAPVAAPAPAPVKDKKKDKKVAPMPAASSKFLPSLMSGYISGGDSDPDAEYYKINGKNSGPPEKKERKNRMGQQARRALWEKKFGKEANHVKSAEEEAREKRERRDAKRLRNGLPAMGEKKPEKEGPLHPSWEAARMAKEKQAKMAEAMFKPQGKKITFD